jgi:hypothetical protein
MEKKLRLTQILSLLLLMVVGNVHARSPSSRRPNIVLVMADDMGYTDIGCYGSEIQTPRLDKLASAGVRFTQFYNTSRCCPTRAALLTGLYSHQAGIGLMTGDSGFDAYRGDLNTHCVTLAEAVKTAGYRTYMSGKWHVTKHTRPQGPNHNWPLQRGFDRFYGTIMPLVTMRSCISMITIRQIPLIPFSCTYPTRVPTGRCMPLRQISKNMKGSMMVGMTPSVNNDLPKQKN